MLAESSHNVPSEEIIGIDKNVKPLGFGSLAVGAAISAILYFGAVEHEKNQKPVCSEAQIDRNGGSIPTYCRKA